MKVAILGGAGAMGRGLAVRLSGAHGVFLGSRDSARGKSAAAEVSSASGCRVEGGVSEDAAVFCDAAILATPFSEDPAFLRGIRKPLAGKLVISAVVPMEKRGNRFVYSKPTGSAAEFAATVLDRSRMAAALHTVPAPKLLDLSAALDFDVPVACDTEETYKEVATIVRGIQGVRPLYAGGLSESRSLESLTPMILNISRNSHLRNLSMKFV